MMLISVISLITICNLWHECKAGKKEKKTATLVFGGDVAFSGPVRYFAQEGRGCDYKKPFEHVKKYFQDADFSLVNLESPFTNDFRKEYSHLPGKAVLHAGEPRAVEGLKYLGVSAVQLSNNHLMDFGAESVATTLETLKNAGISYAGVAKGNTSASVQEPLIRDINGIRIGIIGYCFVEEGCCLERDTMPIGPAIYERSLAMNDIQNLLQKHKVDYVILLAHWGVEFRSIPSRATWTEARVLAHLGADIIIGTHPHTRQVYLANQKKVWAFSLGNLLFSPHFSAGKFFLPHKKGADVDRYMKTANYDWDPTRYGQIVKLVLGKTQIEGSEVLNVNIKQNGPCMQPTPYSDEWREMCGKADIFCMKTGAYRKEYDSNYEKFS